jgi:formylglycine-generating enzyme required for sulfatase activity
MNYPLITEYKQAIADPENSFKDLLPLEPLRKGNDWHFAAGNFATVFKMRKPDDDSHLAVKCFTRHVAGREERQQAVVAYIKAHPKPYFINYQYLPNELFVDSQAAGAKEYPLVAMPWVEGRTLYEEVQSLCNAQNKTALQMLADRFCGLGHNLLTQPFAHGDLKHDNILVRPDGQLVLVDYDGMYVPDLKGQQANEMGGTDYQHPSRNAQHFDRHLDDFSIAIIALSLLALAEQPKLFGKHSQGNHLLISRQDLQNPMASPLMQELELSNDLTVHKLLSLLKGSLLSSELHLANLPKILPEGEESKPEKVKIPNTLLPEMVLVEGGTFMMGATPEQEHTYYDGDRLVHKVTLDSFEIGKYPVTQAQWQAVMGNNPSHFKNCLECPMENVSWNDVQGFIQKLNRITSETYRLPTEAEWEYAARGGKKSRGYKYAGTTNNLDAYAWYDDNSGEKTHPVGQKSPNELGLYDMSGNVWETCQDWWCDYPSSSQTNPKDLSSSSSCVARGGGFANISDAHSTRISSRNSSITLDSRGGLLGFRLARSFKT